MEKSFINELVVKSLLDPVIERLALSIYMGDFLNKTSPDEFNGEFYKLAKICVDRFKNTVLHKFNEVEIYLVAYKLQKYFNPDNY